MKNSQNIITSLYIAFIIGLASNFIPSPSIQMVGGIIFLFAIPAAYILRSKNKLESYAYTHAQYLIKTFWIASLLLLIGAIISIFLADHTKINDVVAGMSQGMVFTQAELNAILINYAFDNIIIFGVCIGPSLIYLGYRIIKGLIKAVNNQRIDNLKTWL